MEIGTALENNLAIFQKLILCLPTILRIHCSHLPTLCVHRYVCEDILQRTVMAQYENCVD